MISTLNTITKEMTVILARINTYAVYMEMH
jgi:hypothetical protein